LARNYMNIEMELTYENSEITKSLHWRNCLL
jgi:hypothetical protein